VGAQPGYQGSGYKLFDAGFNTLMQLEKGPWSEWPEEHRKAVCDTYRKGFEDLQQEIADAKKNVSFHLNVLFKDEQGRRRGREKESKR